MSIGIGIIVVILLATAARQASAVFAPLALALFIIAIVWPLQNRLKEKMPKLLALAITIVVTIVVCLAFASLAAWGFGRVGRSLTADAARYEALYESTMIWLEGHGVSVAALWAQHFNVRWVLSATHQVAGRVTSMLSFCLIAVIYVVLGLLEVEDIRRRIELLDNRELARVLLDGSTATAARFRRYLLVRTQMSAMTGLLVGAFAWITGLQFAIEWGAIAFTLNYIPFLGPFVATLFPTLLAMTLFDSWQAVLGVFVCLNVIQFGVGSYIEPRVAGHMLSISPLVVLFSIFFWTFLWGIFGTFIGVPIALAILTFCDQNPNSRWISDLFGGSTEMKTSDL
jgi:predicted PurR-regulated permease PerM